MTQSFALFILSSLLNLDNICMRVRPVQCMGGKIGNLLFPPLLSSPPLCTDLHTFTTKKIELEKFRK